MTTHRFDALKLWPTLPIMGTDGVGELFGQVLALAAEGWALLDADFQSEAAPRMGGDA